LVELSIDLAEKVGVQNECILRTREDTDRYMMD